MTKETLDSDRVNYMIWRYVFLVIRLLGFQVQDCFSLTAIVATQIPHRLRYVYNACHHHACFISP